MAPLRRRMQLLRSRSSGEAAGRTSLPAWQKVRSQGSPNLARTCHSAPQPDRRLRRREGQGLVETASQNSPRSRTLRQRKRGGCEGRRGAGRGRAIAQWRASPEAESPLAVVARRRRARPRTPLAGILPQVLHRTRDPFSERATGVGEAEGPTSRAGRPLDVADPGCLRATAVGAWGGGRPPAAVGEAAGGREAHPIPGPA